MTQPAAAGLEERQARWRLRAAAPRTLVDRQQATSCPAPGEQPGAPSAAINLILGLTAKISSARGANLCHHGALVRSGTSAIPSRVAEELF